MVDLQSKYRLYSLGYTAIQPRAATPLRELCHETGRKLFSARRDRPVHDCRAEVVKELTAPEYWDAWLLSHGLQSTYGDCVSSHETRRDLLALPEKKTPSKLLFQIGLKGSDPGEFDYPRGVCVTKNSDIAVADSYNHRVQVFNRCGVFKLAFGRQGCREGEFNEPTDVLELPATSHFAVADRRNKRVQVFTELGQFFNQVTTGHPPYSLAADRRSHLAVCTLGRTVELYDDDLHLLSAFSIPVTTGSGSNNVKKRGGGNSPLHVGMSEQGEIIVSDPPDECVKVFSPDGTLLRRFCPQSPTEGLFCCPGGLFVMPFGQILLVDVLNHTVSLYTAAGAFFQQVLTPTDDVGCIHSVSVGPEGHLITSEFSVTGEHAVKMFRYRDCACHHGRPPTSKKKKKKKE
ncbi:protein meiotic P26-like [Babylonia areolata]|uniref:protein meiotic P26-like n=1 Tax=Babylonia areolata TaxID=304850 RepID=UPI003FD41088